MNPVVQKKTHFLILGLTLALVLTGCKKEIRFEAEPNNGFPSATPYSLDETIQGHLDTAEDIDYYRLDIAIPSIVSIELTAVKGINHAFRIWRDDGVPEPVKLIDDNRKSSPERIANFRMDPGTWYIAVEFGERDERKGNTENPYNLTTLSRGPLLEEKEPNDSLEHATVIMTGEEIRGYYSPAVNRLNETGEVPAREEDWYRLTLPEDGEPLQILKITLEGVPGVNGILHVYAPDGTLQMVADTGETGQGEIIEGMSVQRGAYCYLMICSRNFNSSTEPYTLMTGAGPWTADLEREPNNSLESATPMSESTMKGRMNAPGDIDWFSIAGEADTVSRFELQGAEAADLEITIFTTDRIQIGKTGTRKTGGMAVMPLIQSGEDLFVRITGADSRISQGEYTLTRSVTSIPGETQIEREINDNRGSAQPVTRSRILGAVDKIADKDYYLLEYSDRKNVILHLQTPQAGILRISVTDPQGFILRSVEGGKGKELVLKELIERKGYILIETPGAEPGSIYTLSVEVVQ